jgi:hypothetical protein
VSSAFATQADYARAHGVSRTAVTQWKAEGYVTLSGKLVDVQASDRRLRSAAKGRFDPDRGLLNTLGNGGTPRGNYAATEVRLYTEAVAAECARYPWHHFVGVVVGVPEDLFVALRTYLPAAEARSVTERVVAEQRRAAVARLDAETGPPEGLASWAAHPWFAVPPASEPEWAELEIEWQTLKPSPAGGEEV